MTVRRGVFPGTFNPPTIAHLAIVESACTRYELDVVDLTISRRPLGKESLLRPTVDERVEVLRRIADRVNGIGVVVSDAQLIADLATGYDLVIVGADKWAQIHDVAFYGGSPTARDEAVARLPAVAVVPRAGHPTPPHLALDLDPAHLDVSSTLARSGRVDLMAPEALDAGLW